jgi:hypothetical protein
MQSIGGPDGESEKNMKTKLFATLAAGLTLGLAGLAQAADLQTTIPFEFRIGNQSYAPGRYSVSEQTTAGILYFKEVKSGHSLMVVTGRVQRGPEGGPGMLTFRRYGDSFYLSQVWAPGAQVGREVIKSKRETELALTPWPSMEVAQVPLVEVAGR